MLKGSISVHRVAELISAVTVTLDFTHLSFEDISLHTHFSDNICLSRISYSDRTCIVTVIELP